MRRPSGFASPNDRARERPIDDHVVGAEIGGHEAASKDHRHVERVEEIDRDAVVSHEVPELDCLQRCCSSTGSRRRLLTFRFERHRELLSGVDQRKGHVDDRGRLRA